MCLTSPREMGPSSFIIFHAHHFFVDRDFSVPGTVTHGFSLGYIHGNKNKGFKKIMMNT